MDGEVASEIAGGLGGGLGGEGRRNMGVGERRTTMSLKKTEKKKSCAANLPYALIRCPVPNQAELYFTLTSSGLVLMATTCWFFPLRLLFSLVFFKRWNLLCTRVTAVLNLTRRSYYEMLK